MLDFPIEKKKIETMDTITTGHGQLMLKEWLDFPIEKTNETMDRFAKIQGQKLVDTTVRFSR